MKLELQQLPAGRTREAFMSTIKIATVDGLSDRSKTGIAEEAIYHLVKRLHDSPRYHGGMHGMHSDRDRGRWDGIVPVIVFVEEERVGLRSQPVHLKSTYRTDLNTNREKYIAGLDSSTDDIKEQIKELNKKNKLKLLL